MRKKKTQKVVHYARARFFTTPEGDQSLQQLLNYAFRKLSSMNGRTVQSPGGFTVQPRHQRLRTAAFGSLFHLTSFTSNESATTVPHPIRDEDQGDLDAAAPPANADYMDGEAFILVSSNDVVICSTNLPDGRVCWYFDRLIKRAHELKRMLGLSFKRVANLDALKMIEEFGVQSITLDAHLYEASLKHHQRTNQRKTLLGPLLKQLSVMSKLDASAADAHADADLQTQVKIEVGSGQGTIAANRLSSLASSIVGDDPDLSHIRLELGNGYTLSSSRVSLRKVCYVAALNKGLEYNDAFKAIDGYFGELKVQQLLES